MARVPPGEWVPHVEAYVDVSRPAAQHVRSPLSAPPLPSTTLLCAIGFSEFAAWLQSAFVFTAIRLWKLQSEVITAIM